MNSKTDYMNEIQSSRRAACDLLYSSQHLAEIWLKPISAAEGEDGWTPLEVAQHMVYGDWWLVDGVAQTCLELASGQDRAQLEKAAAESATLWARLRRDQKGGLELPGPTEAADALKAVGVSVDAVLGQIGDEDLPKTTERASGPRSIAQRLQGAIDHTNEHLKQLQELKG